MAEARDFKFGIQLGFAKATIKPHPGEKWAWPRAREASIRGAAGMLNLGNLNLYNEETCTGLPYLIEFLNLFTFIYLFNSDHKGR